MKYTILGKTGVLVSELCGGTMSFGGQADEKEYNPACEMFYPGRTDLFGFTRFQF